MNARLLVSALVLCLCGGIFAANMAYSEADVVSDRDSVRAVKQIQSLQRRLSKLDATLGKTLSRIDAVDDPTSEALKSLRETANQMIGRIDRKLGAN